MFTFAGVLELGVFCRGEEEELENKMKHDLCFFYFFDLGLGLFLSRGKNELLGPLLTVVQNDGLTQDKATIRVEQRQFRMNSG